MQFSMEWLDTRETYTTGVVKEKTLKRIWQIPNFVAVVGCDEKLNKEKIKLKTFQSNGTTYTWLIGLTKDLTGVYIFCQLCETSEHIDAEVVAVFETLVRNSREGVFSNKKTVQTYKVNTPLATNEAHLLVYNSEKRSRNLLSEDNTVVIDLELTVLLRQKYLSTPMNVINKQFEFKSRTHSRDNCFKLLKSGEFSDVTIITRDGMEFPAHKLILSTQNVVFAAMLGSTVPSESKSKCEVVNVVDISGKIMEIILHYLYTGDLLPNWSDPDVITEFTYAAGKFRLLNVLKMLDQTLGDQGSDTYSVCYVSLLDVAKEWGLKNAEKRLLNRIAVLTANDQTSVRFLAMIEHQSAEWRN